MNNTDCNMNINDGGSTQLSQTHSVLDDKEKPSISSSIANN